VALKLGGAAYLIWLGLQALRSAGHRWDDSETAGRSRRELGALGGFRQGMISNLANPKIAAFFTSLLPQFIGSGRSVLIPFLTLGGVFVLMTLAWLSTFAILASRASALLHRPRVKAALDRVTGAILIGLGVRLVTEHR
jgi:threonine/homoserine/homoserine lactone efflux protein